MIPAKLTAIRGALAAVLAGVMLTATAGTTPAFAQGEVPWWHLNSTFARTGLPGDKEAQIVVTASNLGDGEVNATSGHTITFTDELPEGVTPVFPVEATARVHGPGNVMSCPPDPEHPRVVTCTSTKSLPPYEQLLVRITVTMNVTEPVASPLFNVVKVKGGKTPQGGEMPPASLQKRMTVDEAPTPFGVEAYELTPENEPEKESEGKQENKENEGWSFDTQAGSHPFQLTTTLDFNQTLAPYSLPSEKGAYPSAPALPRDLHFKLPPGLVGDPSAVAECSEADFVVNAGNGKDLCPPDTALGVASVVINDPTPLGFTSLSVPVFNLAPTPGEPARFGFEVENVPVVLKTSVPSGGEYGVEVSVTNTSQAVQVLSSQVTLWGVPGDPRHDSSRGWECLGGGWWEYETEHLAPCKPMEEQAPVAFLTLPTSCEQPPTTTAGGDSWPIGANRPGSTLQGDTSYTFPSALTSCNLLPFNPSISVQPETQRASTPTGLNVDVEVPQASTLSGAPGALGEADVKETTVTLPKGLELNPSAANGLEVCAASQFGFDWEPESEQTQNLKFEPESPKCPDAAKVGTVKIKTPLLREELTGSVYLAKQDTNLFRSPLVLYLVAEDPTAGVRVKLAGEVTLNEQTGQITSTFKNTPQLPFEELNLHFFGGPRASVSTPPLCQSYATTTSFTAWSGTTQKPESEPPFNITSGPGGRPCPPDPPPFAPSFQAGSTSNQAAGFTGFTLTINRPDGDQALQGIKMTLPPGVAALLSKVTPCPEPTGGQEWACGPESLIGHSAASSGLGGEPYTLPGQVYLTVGYDGAPFGLLVATEAKAGPFNLGMVDVRSKINVDPNTAAVSITTDPGPHNDVLPRMLRGVPVQLKELHVTVDRPEFEFNPTNCNAMTTTGTLTGSPSGEEGVSYPFHVSNCASLPFGPKLTASVGGHASKANGASLDVKVTSAGLGQANIAKVDLALPKELPSRLSTIQQACAEAVFNANPAACDEGSVIGKATIRTPVLKSPLTGPAYLVSHGGAAFPDIEFVLQGEGITLVLDGKVDIKGGVTYSRFEAAPDAPFTSFETELPAGPHSALTAYVPAKEDYSLCKTSLTMPTTITAQNGAVIEQTTNIAATGCGGVLASKAVKLTKAQLLAKALKACKKDKKKRKRLACERQARRRYATKKAVHKTSKTATHR